MRVKLGAQIRVIGFNPQCDSAYHLTSLLHLPVLGIWESAYNGEVWSDERLQAAIHAELGGDALTPIDMLADEPDDSDPECEVLCVEDGLGVCTHRTKIRRSECVLGLILYGWSWPGLIGQGIGYTGVLFVYGFGSV